MGHTAISLSGNKSTPPICKTFLTLWASEVGRRVPIRVDNCEILALLAAI